MSVTTTDGLASDTPTGNVTVGLICPVEVEDGGTGATDLPVSPGPGTMGLTNTLLSANGINPIKPISNDAWGTVGAWDGGQLACIGVSPEGGIELMTVKGSLSSPTALATGDNLGSIWFTGWAGSDFGVTAGQFSCSATENWTDTAQGTQFTFDCIAPGTTTNSRVLTLGTTGATLTTPLTLNPSSGYGHITSPNGFVIDAPAWGSWNGNADFTNNLTVHGTIHGTDIYLTAGIIVEGQTVLQGASTAPTVATADNSTNIATTAWVRAQNYAAGLDALVNAVEALLARVEMLESKL
jgi:hypothetical protein